MKGRTPCPRQRMNTMHGSHTAILAAAIAAIGALLILSGCGGGEPPASLPDTPKPALTEPSGSDASKPQADAQARHLYKEYGEYFVLDADVVMPDGLRDSLHVSTVGFDAEALKSLLMRGQSPALEATLTDDGNISYSVYEGGDLAEHLSVGASGNYVYYRDVGFTRNIKFPTENFVTAAGHSFSSGGNPPYDLVYKEKELAFMPSDKVVSKVRGLLDSLGVYTMPEVKVYAMDCKTMQAHQRVLMEKESDTMGFYDIKDPLTEGDEFYILCFTAACNGFPVSGFAGGVFDRGIWGAEILVYYAERGIVLLNLSGLYAPRGVAQSHESLITAEQAADVAFGHYNEMIADLIADGHDIDEWLDGGKYVVKRAELIYAPTSCSDDLGEFTLTPAWQLTVRCGGLADRYYGEGYDVCEVFTVSAVSGEVV